MIPLAYAVLAVTPLSVQGGLTMAMHSGAGTDDRFEELRVAYHARLKSDRAKVVTLRTQLAKDPESKATYEAIRVCAHGMAGAAAIFEATDIMKAARQQEKQPPPQAHPNNPA